MAKSQNDQMLRALWLAAMAAGGTLRIGPSLVADFPGTEHVWINITTDKQFGDLIISAHRGDNASR
jgi:hypothetical protein